MNQLKELKCTVYRRENQEEERGLHNSQVSRTFWSVQSTASTAACETVGRNLQVVSETLQKKLINKAFVLVVFYDL